MSELVTFFRHKLLGNYVLTGTISLIYVFISAVTLVVATGEARNARRPSRMSRLTRATALRTGARAHAGHITVKLSQRTRYLMEFCEKCLQLKH